MRNCRLKITRQSKDQIAEHTYVVREQTVDLK